MPDEPQLLYLEPDDEITGLVRRLRQTDAARVVLVAPGRTKATSSAVALRLLARLVADDDRQLAIVGDALTRSLAAEAGLAAHSSVADARAGLVATPAAAPQARIRVVRGDEPTLTVAAPRPQPRPRPGAGDETRPLRALPSAVQVQAQGAARRIRRPGALLFGIVVLALLGAGVAAAAMLPSATITITPQAETIGPIPHSVTVDDPQVDRGSVQESVTVDATGTYQEPLPASGAVRFYNFNTVPIEVGQGVEVAAGEVVFATTQSVVVPQGSLTLQGTIQAGEEVALIAALTLGPAGNVPAGAIDTIRNEGVRGSLRGFPQNEMRLVSNDEATTGGLEVSGSVIEQADVDAAVDQLRAALAAELEQTLADREDQEERLFARDATPQPTVAVPDDLVGRRDQPSFELAGTIEWELPYVERADVEAQARDNLIEFSGPLLGESERLVQASIRVTVIAVRREGAALVVDTSAIGGAESEVDADAVRRRVTGMSREAARAELEELGDVRIDLWPGWVGEVPSLDWRIAVSVEQAEGG